MCEDFTPSILGVVFQFANQELVFTSPTLTYYCQDRSISCFSFLTLLLLGLTVIMLGPE